MTELEKKLKISKDTCIHCTTEELAKQVLNIFHQLGLTWGDETHYIRYTYWDDSKENTVYHPFDGEFSTLRFARLTGYKIINAEEFISLHTEGKEFDLENYVPKGELKGFPKEIIARMLETQEEQWGKRDVSVFEKDKTAGEGKKGIIWLDTREGYDFWNEVIRLKNFALFFARYPKKDNSQDFRINDKVYDILLKEVGVVQNIDYSSFLFYGLSVEFKSGLKAYTTNGYYIRECKNPQLLHYQDDYNYDVIDFNNLPKRQEPKRWRAEMGGSYYFVNFYIENWLISNETKDDYDPMDNGNYDSGNYFRTEVEAETMARKLNIYFKQLIKEEQENLAKLKTN